MRKIVHGAAPRPPIGFIILPMIDVIFLLLLFFVIMASFDASTRINVQLPDPSGSQAARAASADRIVVNCEFLITAAGPGVQFRIGAETPATLAEIAGRLGIARSQEVRSLLIRADRRLPFATVRDLLTAAAQAGFENVDVAAMQDFES